MIHCTALYLMSHWVPWITPSITPSEVWFDHSHSYSAGMTQAQTKCNERRKGTLLTTTQRLAMSLYSHQQRKKRKGQSSCPWLVGTSIDMSAKSHSCVLNLPSDKLCYLTARDYSIESWKTVSRLSLISLKESSPYCINTSLAHETQQTLRTRRKDHCTSNTLSTVFDRQIWTDHKCDSHLDLLDWRICRKPSSTT